MILFQEQMRVRDDTLDPAYFANPPRRKVGTGSGGADYDDSWIRIEITNIQNIITELQQQIFNLTEIVNNWQCNEYDDTEIRQTISQLTQDLSVTNNKVTNQEIQIQQLIEDVDELKNKKVELKDMFNSNNIVVDLEKIEEILNIIKK